MFAWENGWDEHDNNDGSSQDYVAKLLKTADKSWVTGDTGIKAALASESSGITIMKGIHQKDDLHITIMYWGEQYHVSVRGGANGDRVTSITKRPFGK